jgi:hypothetical protein
VSRARQGRALIISTTWNDRPCYRICIVNPLTTVAALAELLDDMAQWWVSRTDPSSIAEE